MVSEAELQEKVGSFLVRLERFERPTLGSVAVKIRFQRHSQLVKIKRKTQTSRALVRIRDITVRHRISHHMRSPCQRRVNEKTIGGICTRGQWTSSLGCLPGVDGTRTYAESIPNNRVMTKSYPISPEIIKKVSHVFSLPVCLEPPSYGSITAASECRGRLLANRMTGLTGPHSGYTLVDSWHGGSFLNATFKRVSLYLD